MHFTGAKLISERGGKMTECARDLLKCAQSGDTAARDRLVEDNIPLVKSCIKRFLQSGVPIMDTLSVDTTDLVMDKMFVKEILEKLPQREKSIVILRYFRGMTQTQIAKRLGISQVQVSRIEKKIFAEIREELLTNA